MPFQPMAEMLFESKKTLRFWLKFSQLCKKKTKWKQTISWCEGHPNISLLKESLLILVKALALLERNVKIYKILKRDTVLRRFIKCK